MLRYAPRLAGPKPVNRPCIRKYRGVMTDGSGNSTAVAGECDPGIAVGQMTAGVMTATFSPRPRAIALLAGHSILSGATRLAWDISTAYNPETGTVGLTARRDDTGAAGNLITPGQQFDLFFLTEEGKP